MKHLTYVYSKEKTEDFANIQVAGGKIPPDYLFIHKNVFFRSFSWFFYHIIAVPVLGLYSKLTDHTKIVNLKPVRKALKGQGYFIYSNHTLTADGWNHQCFTCFPKRGYIVSLASTVMHSKILRSLVESLGAIPLPSDLKSAKNFLKCLDYRLNHDKAAIIIYPEGTIWPYYTHQRPVRTGSFKYPRIFDKPVVFACTTFREPKGLFKKHRKPRVVIYLSDPIFPSREKVEKLDENRLQGLYTSFVEKYSSMKENYSFNSYIQKGSKEDEAYSEEVFQKALEAFQKKENKDTKEMKKSGREN